MNQICVRDYIVYTTIDIHQGRKWSNQIRRQKTSLPTSMYNVYVSSAQYDQRPSPIHQSFLRLGNLEQQQQIFWDKLISLFMYLVVLQVYLLYPCYSLYIYNGLVYFVFLIQVHFMATQVCWVFCAIKNLLILMFRKQVTNYTTLKAKMDLIRILFYPLF